MNEACALLGIDRSVLQRRVKAGQYTVERITANGGEQYRIPLTSLPEAVQHKYYLEQAKLDATRQIAEQEKYRDLTRQAERKLLEDARMDADVMRPARGKVRRFREAHSHEEIEALWDWYKRLPTGNQQEAEQNLRIMQAHETLAIAGVKQGDISREICAQFSISQPTLWRLRDRIKGQPPHCWLPLLAPKWKGRTATAEFTEDAWIYIKECWGQQSEPSIKSCYDRAKQIAPEKSWVIPCTDVVEARINALPRWWKTFRRKGEKALLAMYPPLQRDFTTLDLHEMWCADGHKADLFCRWVDADGKTTIGRPIVVAWQDLRSRYFVGYAVGQVESADLIRLAFKNAAETARAIPAHMLLDNGRGFASKLLTGGIPNRYRFKVREEDIPGIFKLLGSEVHWTIPGWGQSKPIEPAWRFIPERVCKRPEFQGAYCGNRPDAKPEECDPQKAVPIERFKAALAEEVSAYNRRDHRGDGMNGKSPLAVYEELLPHTAVRQPTAQQLRLCLLAAESVKPDKKTGAVFVLGNRYWNEKCADLDIDRAYVVRFNPEDANDAISVYDGECFLFDAPIVSRTGFRNQQAAKDQARARNQFKKSRKQEAKAVEDMHRAESWIDPETGAASVSRELPVPKVVIPIRPALVDTAAKEEEPPILSPDEFRVLMMKGLRQQVQDQEENAHRSKLPFTAVG